MMQDVHVNLNPGLPWQKLHSTRSFFHQRIGLKCKKDTSKVLHWKYTLRGAETWTLWKVDQKYLGSSEMWCWRRMEKISWTDRVRNEEVLRRVKKERNILHTVKRRKAN